MAIQTEDVMIPVSDGTSMRIYGAQPEGATRGGILVFQEIFGVNEHIRDVTERFAREGYLGAAPELFHRTGPGFESGYTDMAPGIGHMQQLTDAGLAADIRASFDWLQNATGAKRIPTGSIGYCMGRPAVTLAAMTVPLACGISY